METWTCKDMEGWRDGDRGMDTWGNEEVERWKDRQTVMLKLEDREDEKGERCSRSHCVTCISRSLPSTSLQTQERALQTFLSDGQCGSTGVWYMGQSGNRDGHRMGSSWSCGNASPCSPAFPQAWAGTSCARTLWCMGTVDKAVHAPCSRTPPLIPGPRLQFGSW